MLTDNDIVKALECCVSDGYTCKECPYADTKHMIGDEYELMPNGKTYDEFSCDEWLKLDLFDLINRQKAEIERLTTLAELGNVRANDYRVMRDRALKAEAEVEELKALNEHYRVERPRIEVAAYREFAERLKSKSSGLARLWIDSQLKELVGEDDEA